MMSAACGDKEGITQAELQIEPKTHTHVPSSLDIMPVLMDFSPPFCGLTTSYSALKVSEGENVPSGIVKRLP